MSEMEWTRPLTERGVKPFDTEVSEGLGDDMFFLAFSMSYESGISRRIFAANAWKSMNWVLKISCQPIKKIRFREKWV